MLREFLQKAYKFDGSQNIAAWYLSTKLDGCRCWWDAGITRGMEVKDVPWANTAKDGRYIRIPKATGLWSFYGKPIQAPGWFLDRLPHIPLDGELYMGRGKFQELMKTIKDLQPGPDWDKVKFLIFDMPSYREVLADGEIRNKGKYEKKFNDVYRWAFEKAKSLSIDPTFYRTGKRFEEVVSMFEMGMIVPNQSLDVLPQLQLPYNVEAAKEIAIVKAEEEAKEGGEGVMVRMGGSLWTPKRVRTMLKVKPLQDSEGEVVGYFWGEETELGSKLMGLMGSIIVKWKGIVFKLSGFTEEERLMIYSKTGHSADGQGFTHPGKEVSSDVHNPKFPRGTMITFQYRELSNDGIPREARYQRIRPSE